MSAGRRIRRGEPKLLFVAPSLVVEVHANFPDGGGFRAQVKCSESGLGGCWPTVAEAHGGTPTEALRRALLVVAEHAAQWFETCHEEESASC